MTIYACDCSMTDVRIHTASCCIMARYPDKEENRDSIVALYDVEVSSPRHIQDAEGKALLRALRIAKRDDHVVSDFMLLYPNILPSDHPSLKNLYYEVMELSEAKGVMMWPAHRNDCQGSSGLYNMAHKFAYAHSTASLGEELVYKLKMFPVHYSYMALLIPSHLGPITSVQPRNGISFSKQECCDLLGATSPRPYVIPSGIHAGKVLIADGDARSNGKHFNSRGHAFVRGLLEPDDYIAGPVLIQDGELTESETLYGQAWV